MRRYIIVFPNSSISSAVLQRLHSTQFFELYSNVFYVRGNFDSSRALYSFLQGDDTPAQKMVVSLVGDDYWGYANHELWPWLNNDTE